MNISVEPRWESFIDQLIEEGRYASVNDIIRDGLRLIEAREAKLNDLRAHIQKALNSGTCSEEDIDKAVEDRLTAWEERRKAAS